MAYFSTPKILKVWNRPFLIPNKLWGNVNSILILTVFSWWFLKNINWHNICTKTSKFVKRFGCEIHKWNLFNTNFWARDKTKIPLVKIAAKLRDLCVRNHFKIYFKKFIIINQIKRWVNLENKSYIWEILKNMEINSISDNFKSFVTQ